MRLKSMGLIELASTNDGICNCIEVVMLSMCRIVSVPNDILSDWLCNHVLNVILQSHKIENRWASI